MANTEVRETLQYVRDAESEITAALQQSGLTRIQRDLLDELGDALRDLDNQLALEDLSGKTDDMEKKAKNIARLNQETQEKLKKLQKVADTVEKVAKAVDGIVKVLEVAAKVA